MKIMADDGGVVHRAGPLKQQNKTHKHGRHKSKGTIETKHKGRVDVKSLPGKKIKEARKVDRKNQLKQIRINKRNAILAAKRSLGKEGTPPHLVVVLPLNSNYDCKFEIFKHLSDACDSDGISFADSLSMIFPLTKERFCFLFPSMPNLSSVLNIAKVADTLLLVYGTDEDLSPYAKLVLNTCFAQGLPSTFHVIMGLSQLPIKKQGPVKKKVHLLVEKRFPKEKLHCLESKQDAVNVLRCLGQQKHRSVFVRDARPHLLVDKWDFVPQNDDHEMGLLKVTGYIRGRTLSVNQLVHIPLFGDHQLLRIESHPEPCSLTKGNHVTQSSDEAMIMECNESNETSMEDKDITVLGVADSTKQESLQSVVVPDPMEGEQTWPTEEDFYEAKVERKKVDKVVVPSGTSEYQAAWILDSDGESGDDEDDDDGSIEYNDIPYEANYYSDDDASRTTSIVPPTDMDTDSVVFYQNDNYDNFVNLDDEKKQFELFQKERENQMFPDEVDTPTDIPARTRFARYRGLKNFRSSPWDPKENLPLDYARIFQFSNFRSTRKKALSKTADEGITVGMYVTLYIKDVSSKVVSHIQYCSAPLIVFGLLPHENKMSVVNIVLRRTSPYSQPIMSKDELIFTCGIRTFSASPLYSQHTLGDKHKYERFFPKDVSVVATMYAPITYPPTKVLVFKKLEDNSHILVATGSVLSIDPNRIIVKKAILSGHPFKLYKRSAVIRYMFFNRDDILWFKPVELKTKNGLKGHIKEPLGTHGHMKCVFDKPMKAHDTVLMSLYKRVFPKWNYSDQVDPPSKWIATEEKEDTDWEMQMI